MRIMMCIVRSSFVDKESLRTILRDLVDKNYLTIMTYNTYTIYNPDITKIHGSLKNIKTQAIVKDILNINKETYLTSAIFYNVIFFVCLRTSAMVFTFQIYISLCVCFSFQQQSTK